MIVYSLFDAIPHDPQSILTVGTFDGVHKGHQFIINAMNALKQTKVHARLVVVTFEPHPQLVIPRKDKPPISLLTDISERLQLLESYGVDMVVVIPFTKEFSETSSTDFIRTVIHEKIGCSDIFIGYDQNLPEAFDMLGHPYFVEGTVIKGDQRGRTIGYPTANIQTANPSKLLPMNGVYFISSDLNGITVYGMANIGTRPTVSNEHDVRLEVHFFDIDAQLYDQTIVIWFLSYIRVEQRFTSLFELQEQLQKDELHCRAIIDSLQINDNH
ncbi:MAG: hypothetical protein EBU66_05200 [Bacteroidetes bacterium]|nr:hypothetical protein [Bacteroidota bacterium]